MLNITQPAVSQHIRHLESDYQIKLFRYDGKKIKLTKEGKMLLDAATTVKHDDFFLRGQLRELKKEHRNLAFGTTLTIGEFVIPGRLAAYLRSNSDISVKMLVENTQRLLERLDNGEIDFAIIEGYFIKSEYDFLEFSREKYIPVCGPNYVFSGKGAALEDLLDERLIVREPGSGTREILERMLGEKNLAIQDFRNIVEISNMNAIKSLVRESLGITFLYEAAAREELETGKLKEIPIRESNTAHDFTFVWKKGSIFAGQYKEWFEILKTEAPAYL